MIHSYHALNDRWCKQDFQDEFVTIDEDSVKVETLTNIDVSIFGERGVKERLFVWKLQMIT